MISHHLLIDEVRGKAQAREPGGSAGTNAIWAHSRVMAITTPTLKPAGEVLVGTIAPEVRPAHDDLRAGLPLETRDPIG